MTLQTDFFAAGETRSLPPHLDPAIVGAIQMRSAIDRDHVGSADVGRYGNNAAVVVLEVMDKAGGLIFAQQFPADREREAMNLANDFGRRLEANRQADLFG